MTANIDTFTAERAAYYCAADAVTAELVKLGEGAERDAAMWRRLVVGAEVGEALHAGDYIAAERLFAALHVELVELVAEAVAA